MRKRCECCNKKIENHQKWCSNCASYIKPLLQRLIYYKRAKQKYCIKLYGVKSGSERIRK